MNTSALSRILFILSSLCIAWTTHAQNLTRLEEERALDAARKAKVEEAIRAREAEAREIEEHPEIYENPEKKQLVEVEPNNILPADLTSSSALIPYKIRRASTGADVGISASTYEPVNYESDFISATLPGGDYASLYGKPSMPMIELYLNYKWNNSFGSIGSELGIGFFKNSVTTDGGDHLSLTAQPIRFGAKFILDNLGYEPKIAPYGSIGGYIVMFKEDNEISTTDGNTQLALYYTGGVLFQLSWLDQASAVEAYSEAGIENTFLFAEARQYQKSGNADDPDFSTDLIFNVGLSLEF